MMALNQAAHEMRTAMTSNPDPEFVKLVEDALRRTPEERLEEHQRALNLVLEIIAARQLNQEHGSGR